MANPIPLIFASSCTVQRLSAPKRAILFDQLPRHFNRVGPLHAGAQKDRDQFRVVQRARSARGQFFARPIVLRHFTDFQLRHHFACGESRHGPAKNSTAQLFEQFLQGLAQAEKGVDTTVRGAVARVRPGRPESAPMRRRPRRSSASWAGRVLQQRGDFFEFPFEDERTAAFAIEGRG